MHAASPSRPLLALTWLCIAAALAQLVVLTQRVERTPDELNYQLAGRLVAARQPLVRDEHRFQGPLILLGTQLTDTHPKATTDDALRAARIGMLVFPALLLVGFAFWVRAALGAAAGAWAAFLAATNPTLLAYGPLLSSDVAFTAVALLLAWATWRWFAAPSPGRLAAVGALLGAVMATKYTAVLSVGAAALLAVLAWWRGFDPWPRRDGSRRAGLARLLGLAAAGAAAAVLALLALHAAYLFAAPMFSAASPPLRSDLLRAAAATAPAKWLLGLLPEPLVLGIDYQSLWAGRRENGTFLDQRGNHWAYYPVTVLCKTPTVVLLAAAAGLFAALRARQERAFWACLLLPAGAVLAFCSATRALQMGVRYVLPVVPALLALAAAWLGRPWPRRAWQAAAALAVVVASLWNLAAGWPHFVGFFNVFVGGQTGGWRVVADGNCDWNQRYDAGRQALLARHPDLEVAGPGLGPRLGRFAVYVDTLLAVDPLDHGRVHHWLRRFRPFDHDGAAWFACAATPEAFGAAIAAGDHRAAADLAYAWLARDDIAQARAALARAIARDDPAVERARAIVEEYAASAGDPRRRDALARELSAAGDDALALALVDRDRRDNAVFVFWLRFRTGQVAAAIDGLEAQSEDGSRTVEEVVYLASSLVDGGRDHRADPQRARDLMQRGPAPAADSPWHGLWRELERRVADAIERETYYRDR
jgi:4-amino-4-deoxy-L-arabinose transferase-like glycosyltransferase